MTSGMSINRIIEFVNCFTNAIGEDDINKILEYFNIIKFYSVENFKNIIKTETEGRIDEVIKILQGIIGKYVGINKSNNFLSLYEEVDISYKEDFWELIDRYNIYKHIENAEFGNFLKESNLHYSVILKYMKTVDNFDEVLRDHMLQDSTGAEILLHKYIYNNEKGDITFLPKSLTDNDKDKIVLNYIESERPNINHSTFAA